MAGMRWRSILAIFSMTILAATVTFDVSSLAAKDNTSKSASAGSKSSKAKSSNRTTGNSGDTSGSSDQESVGGGGQGGNVVGGPSVAPGMVPGTNRTSGGTSPRGVTSTESSRSSGAVRSNNSPKQTRNVATRKSSNSSSNSKRSLLDAQHPLVKRVIEVQNKNQYTWMTQKGVVGTSTGLDEDGNVVIRVQVTGADNPTIPSQIDGVAIVRVLAGPIKFAAPPPTPAPIGTSTYIDITGNPTATPAVPASTLPCAGTNGTIACRLKGSNSQVYALSCNHVYAGNELYIASWDQATQTATDQLVTFFALGRNATAPAEGSATVNCRVPYTTYANTLGTLAVVTPFFAFYTFPNVPGGPAVAQYTTTDPHVYNGTQFPPTPGINHPDTVTPTPPGNPPANNTPTNLTDSALVLTAGQSLDTSTPSGGYGIPTPNYAQAYLGMPVQKYGTGSKLTYGSVTGLNQVYTIVVNISNPLTPQGGVLIKQSFTNTVINGTGGVSINSGIAGNVYVPFSQQIEITPTAVQPPGVTAGFAFPGDSGALVVTHNDPLNPGNNPVCMVQATDLNGGAYCGDFQNILNDLQYWFAQAGTQVVLTVDNGPSAIQGSQDGKIGRQGPSQP